MRRRVPETSKTYRKSAFNSPRSLNCPGRPLDTQAETRRREPGNPGWRAFHSGMQNVAQQMIRTGVPRRVGDQSEVAADDQSIVRLALHQPVWAIRLCGLCRRYSADIIRRQVAYPRSRQEFETRFNKLYPKNKLRGSLPSLFWHQDLSTSG